MPIAMRTSLRLLVPAVVCGLVLAGCATTPQAPAPEAAQSAESAIAQGNLVFAAQEYERLAKSKRNAREHYLLLAAEAWRDEGEFGEVRRVLATVKRKNLSAAQNTQLDLLLAEALLDQGEFEQADTLLTMPEANIPASERTRFLELKAKALEGSKRVIDAMNVRAVLHGLLDAAEQNDNAQSVLRALKTLKPKALNAALTTISAADLRRPWLEQALRDQSTFPPRAQIRPTRPVGAWQTGSDGVAQAEGHRDPGKIALLLPLTGDYACAGQAVRDGFMTAWFASDGGGQAEVQVYDSGVDAASLQLAVDSAIKAGARSIVGPLERNQVEALFAQVPAGVTILALNHPEAGPVPPSGQFQFGLSPEEEAALAAERLFDAGVRRSAMILSQEDWAERAGKAFNAQFSALGGSVLGERRVAPAAVKFNEELDALIGAPRFEAAAVSAADAISLDADGNPLPPPKPRMLPVLRADGPEALFVAIRSTQGRMLMPQLRARSQDALIVLATSHIASGSGNITVDRDLEGVNFIEAPFVFDSTTAIGINREQLAAALPSAIASARLFAFGVDACRLLPYLAYLRENEGSYLAGATGQLMIDGFGRVRRLSSGYRFQNGVPQFSESLLPVSGVRIEAPAANLP